MSTALENTTGYKSFTATATAIEPYARVKVENNGLISAAGAAEAAVGITLEQVAAGGLGTVKLFAASGSFPMRASAAIPQGALVYPAAGGRIAATGATALGFQTIEAATASGDVVECVRVEKGA